MTALFWRPIVPAPCAKGRSTHMRTRSPIFAKGCLSGQCPRAREELGTPPPRCIMGKGGFGVLWDGQYEALNRLVLGTGFDLGGASVGHGMPAQEAPALQRNLVGSVRDRATQYSGDSVGRNLSSGL